MKTAPSDSTSQNIGPRYWRGPEDLADSAAFRTWVEQEFPAGAEQMMNGSSRREFVKLMSASFMLAGLGMMGAGCRRLRRRAVATPGSFGLC